MSDRTGLSRGDRDRNLRPAGDFVPEAVGGAEAAGVTELALLIRRAQQR